LEVEEVLETSLIRSRLLRRQRR
jgi:hypothetical protein